MPARRSVKEQQKTGKKAMRAVTGGKGPIPRATSITKEQKLNNEEQRSNDKQLRGNNEQREIIGNKGAIIRDNN